MRFLTAALLLSSSWAAAQEDTKTPPPFFLIDTTDQLCLSGEEFKRCSIDTLFYVVGPPGKLDTRLGLRETTLWSTVLERNTGASRISSHPELSN